MHHTHTLFSLFLLLLLSTFLKIKEKTLEFANMHLLTLSFHFSLLLHSNYLKITKEKAQELADKITGGKYLECSAKTNLNVNEIFIDLIRQIALKNPPPVRSRGICALF